MGDAPVDDPTFEALRRCSEQFLNELHLARCTPAPLQASEWRAHVQYTARLAVPLLHVSGGSVSALKFVEEVVRDGGVQMLVEAGVATPLARVAAQTCAATDGASGDDGLTTGLLTSIFEAGCGAAFAESLESTEAVACVLVALESPRAPRVLPSALLDKVDGKGMATVMTTALSRVWATAMCPATCECVCDIATRTFAASTDSVEAFVNLRGIEIALGIGYGEVLLRLFAAMATNVAKAPRVLHFPDAMTRLRSKLVDAIVHGCYSDCPSARESTSVLVANSQLRAILFENDMLACSVTHEFLRRVDRDEPFAARIACRGFAHGMARALMGTVVPSTALLATAVRAYCRTETTVAHRDERVPVCDVLCHWSVRVGSVESQLVVLRDAFKLLTTGEAASADPQCTTNLELSATLLLECVGLPDTLKVPREHAVFLIARSLAGRKCPASTGVLGRRFRRLLAEVAEQFVEAYNDDRPMLQHALDVINFYDVLCESTREALLLKLRALPLGPPEASLLSEFKCPITLQPFVFPVLMPDTHTYELEAIVTHFLSRIDFVSPFTRGRMEFAPVYNRALAKVACEVATRVHGRRRRRAPPLSVSVSGVQVESATPRQI